MSARPLHKPPTTDNRPPTTSQRPPTADRRPATTDHQPATTDNPQPTADCRPGRGQNQFVQVGAGGCQTARLVGRRGSNLPPLLAKETCQVALGWSVDRLIRGEYLHSSIQRGESFDMQRVQANLRRRPEVMSRCNDAHFLSG